MDRMDRLDRMDRMERIDRMDRYSQSGRNTDMHNDRSGMMDSNRGMNIMNNHRDRNSPQYHNNNHNNNMHSNHSNHANHSNHSNNHQNNHLNNSHPNSHGNHHTPSPSYCPDNGIKSDSPSRKRRRVSRVPSQSPPSMWEQRQSPRNQQQVNTNCYFKCFLLCAKY